MTEHNTADCLTLLNDSVLDLKNGKDKDAFNHDIYAKLLASIFNPSSHNDPGISVALFGKWGQGKSSVVQMMESMLGKQQGASPTSKPTVKVIWFNAWKTRGDHVRRQLLLSIIKGIESPKYEEISRFVQPGNPLAIRPYCVQEHLNNKTHWWVMVSVEKIDPTTATIIIVGALSFILWLISLFVPCWTAKLSAIPLLSFFGSCMVYGWRFFSERKTHLLTSAEPVSDSQRLKYPDQFQRVFEEELAEYKKRNSTPIVVVVDDLDRCEASTVVEALACIRQLGGKPIFESEIADCRFLVPCDESQVLCALERDGHHKGYEKEDLLRKFFDVIIRMDSFLPDDMVAYAKQMLTSFTGMTESDSDLIQELVGAVSPRNPRQVKKLINAYIIFKTKLAYLQAICVLRPSDKLEYFDKTSLLVIALQETVPDVYDSLIESSTGFDLLFDLERTSTDSKRQSSQSEERALRIIRALEPVSFQTFTLLTRKGIPEALKGLENGPNIYDAFQLGKADTFEIEIAKVTDVDILTAWLREHRKSLTSVAQFRNALPCLFKPSPFPPWLKTVIDDYISGFKKLSEAFNGFDGLLEIARRTCELGHCKWRIHNTVLSNLRDKADNLTQSTELKAVLLFADDLSDAATTMFATTLAPQLTSKDIAVVQQRLPALRSALPKGLCVHIPKLAITIASDSMWSIYNTSEPDKHKGLHSDLIAAFAGEDASTTSQIVDILLKGPLATPINLKSTSSQKGEREALRTLASIAKNLLPSDVSKLYDRLIQWINNQNDMDDFKFVCDILRSIWPRLSEAQIDAFAKLLTERCNTATDAEWLSSFVGSEECYTDSESQMATRFCKKVLIRLNEVKLTNNTFDEPAKKLLKGMADHKWPIADDADTIFANAVKSKIGDKSTWDLWSNSFWPLVENQHPMTESAIRERIKQKHLPDVLIPFAIERICGNQISLSLATTLKEYFVAEPNSVKNKYFVEIFDNSAITGGEQIIKLIVDDLAEKNFTPTDPQVAFISKAHDTMPSETKALLDKYVRINYLQGSDLTRFSLGISYIHTTGTHEKATLELIGQIAREQGKSLSTETHSLIKDILGEDRSGKQTS